jgi:hypothetical protein
MQGVSRRTVLHGALGAAVVAAMRPASAQVSPIVGELMLLQGLGGNVVALKTSESGRIGLIGNGLRGVEEGDLVEPSE